MKHLRSLETAFMNVTLGIGVSVTAAVVIPGEVRGTVN